MSGPFLFTAWPLALASDHEPEIAEGAVPAESLLKMAVQCLLNLLAHSASSNTIRTQLQNILSPSLLTPTALCRPNVIFVSRAPASGLLVDRTAQIFEYGGGTVGL
ncbi:hypothetical protein G7Y89_g7961 [Cudoniella acicularis]|uniref:Uncharacterized protein n=1 Tax=Cudoniella acicularis TaxID=354080 RepID=A0A8H4RJS3_9HELO|nr:hypothetical protein G7Y89_g7961 [Cudoniella acicularis]